MTGIFGVHFEEDLIGGAQLGLDILTSVVEAHHSFNSNDLVVGVLIE